MTGLLILMGLGFLCSFIGAIIGICSSTGSSNGSYISTNDMIEPMYKYPPMNTNVSDHHEVPQPKQDDHFIEKVTYVGAMKSIWEHQN